MSTTELVLILAAVLIQQGFYWRYRAQRERPSIRYNPAPVQIVYEQRVNHWEPEPYIMSDGFRNYRIEYRKIAIPIDSVMITEFPLGPPGPPYQLRADLDID